jgi:hypothetical protein
MALTVTYLNPKEPKMAQFRSGTRLYLNADKTRVITDENDPDAKWLLVAEGGSLPEEDARKYSLYDMGVEYREPVATAAEPSAADLMARIDRLEADLANMRAVVEGGANPAAATAAPGVMPEGKAVTVPPETKVVEGPQATKAAAADVEDDEPARRTAGRSK